MKLCKILIEVSNFQDLFLSEFERMFPYYISKTMGLEKPTWLLFEAFTLVINFSSTSTIFMETCLSKIRNPGAPKSVPNSKCSKNYFWKNFRATGGFLKWKQQNLLRVDSLVTWRKLKTLAVFQKNKSRGTVCYRATCICDLRQGGIKTIKM